MDTTSQNRWIKFVGKTIITPKMPKPEEPHIHLPDRKSEMPIAGMDLWEIGEKLHNVPAKSGSMKFVDTIYPPSHRRKEGNTL
jgi:hypothetical protein